MRSWSRSFSRHSFPFLFSLSPLLLCLSSSPPLVLTFYFLLSTHSSLIKNNNSNMTFEVELAWFRAHFLVTWLWASYLFSPSLPPSICSLKLIQAHVVLLHFAFSLFTCFCVLLTNWRQDLPLAKRLQHTTLPWSGTKLGISKVRLALQSHWDD